MVTAASPSACLLIVEGDDDEHVAAHLARANSAMPFFRTRVTRGFPGLLAAIGPEIKSPGRLALGMMVDANEDPRGRWRSLRGRLGEEGVTLPDAPERNGTIVEAGPRIGIWMMPDNQSSGELEDFIEKLIPPDDPVWKMACQFIDAIPDSERKFPGHKQTKAKGSRMACDPRAPAAIWRSNQQGRLAGERTHRHCPGRLAPQALYRLIAPPL